jgi:YVTN family beta-propeller protein
MPFTGMHTHRIVGNFSVGYNPYLFCYDPENKLIYLTEMGGNVVTVINSTNNAIIAIVPVGQSPTGITYDPANNEIYVANSGSNFVIVINSSSNSVISNVTVTGGFPT